MKPKLKWKEAFTAIRSDDKEFHEHNGKKFTVLEDKTEPYFKTKEGEEEYGYSRCYRIRLEDGTEIDALECEVEDFE